MTERPTRFATGAILLLAAGLSSTRAHEWQWQTLHSFPLPPAGNVVGLIEGADGDFYGATAQGGADDFGAVFKLRRDRTCSLVVWFNDTNGTSPSSLYQANS